MKLGLPGKTRLYKRAKLCGLPFLQNWSWYIHHHYCPNQHDKSHALTWRSWSLENCLGPPSYSHRWWYSNIPSWWPCDTHRKPKSRFAGRDADIYLDDDTPWYHHILGQRTLYSRNVGVLGHPLWSNPPTACYCSQDQVEGLPSVSKCPQSIASWQICLWSQATTAPVVRWWVKMAQSKGTRYTRRERLARWEYQEHKQKGATTRER